MSNRSIPKKIELDTLGQAIYALLLRRIGYKRTPTAVPAIYIAKCVKATRRQIQWRMEKLIKAGLIERWTTKHPTQFKISYYRIPYLVKELEKVNPPYASDRSHRFSANEHVSLKEKKK